MLDSKFMCHGPRRFAAANKRMRRLTKDGSWLGNDGRLTPHSKQEQAPGRWYLTRKHWPAPA